ncbi:MAG: hypothetical protein AB4426_05290 [Xenococcaceae cyanobacterium]
MKNWPSWIPSPNSWMSAIVLALLMSALVFGGNIIWPLIQLLIGFLPRLGIIVWFLAYISPIFLIAVAHHILHLFLDKYFPNTPSPEIGKVQGFIPGLMSWWEGLYGWLVIFLSMLVSNTILAFLFSPRTSPYELLDLQWSIPVNIPTVRLLIWGITAAYLYHFENSVRQRLMTVGSASQSNQ